MKILRDFLELIKFEHTIFALPFAYLGMILAADGLPTWDVIFWITLAMASARTLAMGSNRIADRWIDARNPRTAERPLNTGRISIRTAWAGTVLAGVILALAVRQLGPLPWRLLPGAYLFLVGYSFTKRFTWLSHFVLGFTDGLAPLGAWAAIRGSLFTLADLPAWVLMAVVTLWIGGFDLIYACQDVDFDREHKLYSVPARMGVAFSLRLSGLLHALTTLLLLWPGAAPGAGLAVLGWGWSSSPVSWPGSTRWSGRMTCRGLTWLSLTSTAISASPSSWPSGVG